VSAEERWAQLEKLHKAYSPASAATPTSSTTDALSSGAPARGWQPYGYGGYVPDRLKSAQASPAREIKGAAQSDPLSSAPAKKWQPYGGYVPKRDRPHTPAPAASASYSAPASYAAPSTPLKTDPLSSAPAKKWQPYGGYEPKRDRPMTDRPHAPAPSGGQSQTQSSSWLTFHIEQEKSLEDASSSWLPFHAQQEEEARSAGSTGMLTCADVC
jgi:hypothetical protein